MKELVDGGFYWLKDEGKWVVAKYEATGDHGHPGLLVTGVGWHVGWDDEDIGPYIGKEPEPDLNFGKPVPQLLFTMRGFDPPA